MCPLCPAFDPCCQDWERLIGVGYGVNVFNWNHECIKKSCDSSCFCGHCAGPGVCNQDQCEPSVLPDWTQETAVGGAVTFEAGALVGYILTIIVSTLGVSFAVGTVSNVTPPLPCAPASLPGFRRVARSKSSPSMGVFS